MQRLNIKEQEKLISIPNEKYPTGIRNKVLIKLTLETGLKTNEIVNLKWDDIDFDNIKLINVRAIDITLAKKTKDILKRWKDRQKIELEKRGIREDIIFIFTTLKGEKISGSYLRQMLYRYSDRAELDIDVCPSVLRNTFAFALYQKTKDLKEIQLTLGYEDINGAKNIIKEIENDLKKSEDDIAGTFEITSKVESKMSLFFGNPFSKK